jgi:hypothetical protein
MSISWTGNAMMMLLMDSRRCSTENYEPFEKEIAISGFHVNTTTVFFVSLKHQIS